MRWKPAIAIAWLVVVCAGSFLCWQYTLGPVKRINALRARAAQGDPKAQFNLASAYYRGKGAPQDYAEALRWYKMAADQGEPRAEDALGYMYVNGVGVPQDYAQGLECYRSAAEQGNAKAQFDLASMYYYATGVRQNYAEAVRWARKAADQNYAMAEDALGSSYSAGLGVSQDYSEALRWYRRAAEQGYAKAEFDLASMYYKGLGTPQNYAEARRWCIKAAKQGNADAKQALAVLGAESGTVTKLEYIQLVIALFPGIWVLRDVLLHGKKKWEFRQVALLVLGSLCLVLAGMNVYVILQGGLLYCSYPLAFHIVQRSLAVMAILIFVTIARPAKKKPNAATGSDRP